MLFVKETHNSLDVNAVAMVTSHKAHPRGCCYVNLLSVAKGRFCCYSYGVSVETQLRFHTKAVLAIENAVKPRYSEYTCTQ